MTEMLALMLSTAGFGAVALSMHRHHRDLFGAPPPRGRAMALRIGGCTLLVVAITPCVAASGWSVGLILWFGLITVAALMVALSLTYGPGGPARRKRA